MIRDIGAVFGCGDGHKPNDWNEYIWDKIVETMLTSYKGYFENGKVELTESPPVQTRTEVIVTFLEPEKTLEPKRRIPGGLKGKIGELPDDFNEPLEDLKDYM